MVRTWLKIMLVLVSASILPAYASAAPVIPHSGQTDPAARRAAAFQPTGPTTPGAQWVFESPGQIGGSLSQVAFHGDYVYVTSQRRLVVLDVSNPQAPALVGQSPPFAAGLGSLALDADASHAYAKDNAGTLHILDIADPTTPFEIATYPCREGGGIEIAGNLVYLVGYDCAYHDCSGSLSVLDVSDPAHPVKVGGMEIPGAPVAFTTGPNHTLYVAEHYWGALIVLDISDPTHPEMLSFITGLTDNPWALRVTTNVGGAATLWMPGSRPSRHYLSAYDLSQPTDPSLIGTIDLPGQPLGLANSGQYAYVAMAGAGLAVIDTSDPTHMVRVGTYDTRGSAMAVASDGALAYVADGPGGLSIIDVVDPAHPLEIGAFWVPGLIVDVATAPSGAYAYLAARPAGLVIVDVTDPSNASTVGALPLPGSATLVAVSPAQDLAFVATGSTLHVVDVTEATHPNRLGELSLPQTLMDMAASDDSRFAYLLSASALWVVDVSNPSAPSIAGQLEVAGLTWSRLAADGPIIYAVTNLGLKVVDASDPAHPLVLASVATDDASAVASDARGFLFKGVYGGMSIFDMRDPARPVKISEVDFGPPAEYVVSVITYNSQSGMVYVWFEWIPPTYDPHQYGLRAINVQDPWNPVQLAHMSTNQIILGLASNNNYVFVCERFSGDLVAARLLRERLVAAIPTAGGSIVSGTGAISLVFPGGAFGADARVTYRRLLTDQYPGNLVGIGHIFDISAVDAQTNRPLRLEPAQTYSVVIRYSEPQLGSITESTLALYRWGGDRWVREPSSQVHPDANTVTATPNNLGLWAVLGDTYRSHFPLIATANTD